MLEALQRPWRAHRRMAAAASAALAVTVGLAVATPQAHAIEFLFSDDGVKREFDRKCDGIDAIAKYKRGRVGQEYYLEAKEARYEYRTHKVMVQPPKEIYRWQKARVVYDKHLGHEVEVEPARKVLVEVQPAVFKTVTERVLVEPVRYRARQEHGQHGYVKERAVVDWRQGPLQEKCKRRQDAFEPHK